MSGFFLGRSEEPLYGYYHEPGVDTRGQILLCQPWGPEYEFAHRTMRFLARRLASRGWHVLRFDYRGTGDSWGDTTDADLDGWVEDTAVAAAELRAITNLSALGLVGLRLGATIGALAADRIGSVDRTVLWDPIVDGPAWIREVEALGLANTDPRDPGDRIELGGRTITSSFLAQLAEIELSNAAPPSSESLVLWTQEQQQASASFSGPSNTAVEHLSQPSPWLESISLEAGQIPVEAITRVVEWIDG